MQTWEIPNPSLWRLDCCNCAGVYTMLEASKGRETGWRMWHICEVRTGLSEKANKETNVNIKNIDTVYFKNLEYLRYARHYAGY